MFYGKRCPLGKKNGISYFGYKNHISVDVKYGFVWHYVVTDVAVHDSQVFSQLVDINGSEIWGDSAMDNGLGLPVKSMNKATEISP